MRFHFVKSGPNRAVGLTIVLLLGTSLALAQQQVNLTAGPSNAILPDGTTVPMWGYSCGTAVTGSTATCAPLNPNAAGGWSPVVITVPTGVAGGLTINLTNNLSFANSNTVPTSIMIVGQVGGGLGSVRTATPSPDHPTQSVTWPTANSGPTNVPPPQGPRVQSFATEVAGGATTLLPPWTILKPGTYLLESGSHPSIQGPMGLYGILVVTAAPTGSGTAPATTETAPGCAYYVPAAATPTCAVPYDAEVPMLLSEIDPAQNTTVSVGANTSGFSETAVWSGQPGGCGNPASSTYLTCYPPAVNYTPLYYMINGVAFNKNNTSGSLFPVTPANIAPAAGTTGNVLVRLVNAGLRMHVPAIVGSQVAGATGGTNPVVAGFKIMAEDGNPRPGVPKVQSEVFMAAGKTFDVMINGQSTSGTTITPYASALAVYDRELSLSANATVRDAGMLAYIGIDGKNPPIATGSTATPVAAAANPDSYSLAPGVTLTVSDPGRGVIANDRGVFTVEVLAPPTNGTVLLNPNGTFVYYPTAGSTATSDTFTYCANGRVTAGVCTSGISTTVTLGPPTVADTGITCAGTTFSASVATYLAVKTPGVLAGCTDAAGLPLTLATSSVAATTTGLSVLADANGGFTAIAPGAGTYTFTVNAQNAKGQTAIANVTLAFPAGSGLTVTLLDGQDKTTQITDYRWIIEEDRTFYIDPKCTSNPPPAGCPTSTAGIVPTLGINFHTSYMPYVAQGCTGPVSCEAGQTIINPATGMHVPATCDVGNGVCRTDSTAANGFTQVMPGAVALDPTKRYYISVLPGDAANPFAYGYSGAGCQSGAANAASGATCGHGMGGAPISPGQSAVTVITQPSPYPPGKLSVFAFEDDFPLNGEQDGGGGVDVLAPREPGLGGFQIHLWDAMGGNGDFTGQMTYDMFNQPLSNSLAGTIDPATKLDACPISVQGTENPAQAGITGMIVTCPKYESDGATLSPLAGQAVIANLMPGRWGVIATPGADRIARGEEWLQTNTLDGQKAHDVFTRIGEPSYFQEFGPAGYHVSVGFASPAIINARHPYVCNGTDPSITGMNCHNTLTGKVTGERLSRTPDERLYSSGSHDTFYWTQCYVSFGDADGEDFAFTKCNADGTFTLTGLPDGDWRITVFDQWNDLLVDGLSTPVRLSGGAVGGTTNIGDIATTQWQANLYTRTFIDDNKDGLSQGDEAGIPFANVAVRLRDGSLENLLVTDFTGTASFNETFPLFAWYTVETDVTRYKNTGTHVVYDVGGPADGSASCGQTGYPPCGTSTIGKFLANTAEVVSVPTNLRVPGSVYCAGADCTGKSIQNGPGASDPPSVCTTSATGVTTCSTKLSSGRIDPPWIGVEGWQGFPGQNNFLEFGKEPYVPGENGGIKGHVIYASTRPFDDPQMLVQTQWEPLVPHVTINLYQEGIASDGVTQTFKLVDTTQTSSWDDYAQGFRADGVTPNMNCPGQGANSGAIPDLFYFSLNNQPNYLNFYNSQHGGPALTPLPNNSQFKCYDGMHNWNQIQPAPYDGMYKFPSVTAVDANGKPTLTGTNCTICTANTAVPTTDLYYGIPQLPAGKYVVEVVLPPGYELVKEEDKNILIGDNFIAPVTQEFGGLGNIFILPDQASVAASEQYPGPGYNQWNAQNPTQSFGASPNNGIVPGFVPEPVWPCVGEARIVPDYISLYPQSKQVAPFAGATRNLCDRKEVTLGDQMGATAKFFIYTSIHIASKFTGGITDDFTSEFDPFSPSFGEKFAPPDLPVAVKDWTGNEISRVYADHWGAYDGMTYSTWEVNPPNPTGYSPTMMVFCINDRGTGTTPDPLYNSEYSQFCYELPFMPGTTQYLDTPVVPTAAFAGAGYNNVDCAYPSLTPAIAEVDGDGVGPWVSASGHTLTITALGDQIVPNYGYSGPSATTAPYNQKTVTRHYGFGATQGTGSVTIGGVATTVTSWSDTSITVTVPPGVPPCAVQQQAQYANPMGGTPVSTAQCGQLLITAGNGKKSIDAVTVTIGGKAPTHVLPSGSIQNAIDAAYPGDLIIVNPGTYNELLLMWKPLRLQGVGASSSIIDANPHPAGKLDPWRAKVNCLFGLALNGQPYSTPGNLVPNPVPGQPPEPINLYDPTGAITCGGWTGFNGGPNNPQVDRLPLESLVGWDTTVNGNLAELLQEPSLMGAYEGAGITVLAKGVRYPPGVEVFGGCNCDNATGSFVAHEGQMPVPTVELTANDCSTSSANPFPSNFQCNPSRIDGLAVTNSSQGGGGILIHAWAHNLEIANNRIYNNTGSMSGGISIGQTEAPDALLAGNGGDPIGYNGGTLAGFDQQPWTCAPGAVVQTTSTPYGYDQVVMPPGFVFGQQLPYCYNLNVNVHNNSVTANSSLGDEAFSSTPAGGGGVTFCTGADYYKFNYNWVCGNLSAGDGGGFSNLGFSYNGDIEHNSILFNQSTNPTLPTNGGGIIIMNTAPDGSTSTQPECGSVTDVDCAPGLGDGTGPGLVINANLIMGNAAESGSGGGLRFQGVNGTEVSRFPSVPSFWYDVTVTNNIIANNVAGWDGAGVSLQDALKVNLINNTIISNDSTASSGVLFNTLGAPLASSQGPTCTSNCGTTSLPQPAGLVSIQNSSNLTGSLPATVICPSGHAVGVNLTNGACRNYSVPILYNDVFWQNRSFHIGVGALGTGAQNQQNVVALYNAFTTTQVVTQPSPDATAANGNGAIITGGTGACVTPASYWDIGVRGDTGPSNHSSGLTLAPTYSVITDAGDYAGANNTAGNPTVLSQYCNGSRTPPEFKSLGYQVPPGISDATVPNPIFNLTPVATVDEGNNWINITWGPLSLTNPITNTVLGNYALAPGSPAIDLIPSSSPTYAMAPTTDFFGNPRPDISGAIDVGAVEFQAGGTAVLRVSPTSLSFGTSLAPQILTLSNTGGTQATGITLAFVGPFTRGAAGGTCGTTLAAGTNCTINVVFRPTAVGAANGTLTITANVPVVASPVALSGTGVLSATLTPPTWSPSANPGVGSSGPLQVFSLTNTGNITITGITQGVLSGPSASDYAIVGLLSTCGPAGTPNGQLLGQTTLAPTSLPCIVTVQFRPPAGALAGSVAATLSVTDSAGTLASTLNGTVKSATSDTRSPSSLTFAAQGPGVTSAAQSVTVRNTGNTTLPVTIGPIVGSNPGDFTIASNNCTSPLAVGASCAIGVTFQTTAGTAAGTYTAALNLTLNGAANNVALTGRVKTLTPTALSFPNTAQGTVSATQLVTLANPAGSGTLAVTLTFSGTNSTYFHRSTTTTGTCGANVPAGGSCTIAVVFAPPSTGAGGTTGAKSAVLTAGGLQTTLSGTAQ
jgi:hypothetical protein